MRQALRGFRFVAPLAAAAALVAACSSAATPQPTTAPTPAPTQAAASPAAGSPAASGHAAVQMTLPSGWQTVELTKAAFDAEIAQFSGSNPQLAQVLQQAETSGMLDKLAYYALGYNGSDLIGNINAIEFPGAGDPNALVPTVEGQFKQVGATDVSTTQTTILGGNTPVISYNLPISTSGSSVTVAGKAYLVSVGGTVYDVTLTCYGTDNGCLQQGDQAIHGMTVGP